MQNFKIHWQERLNSGKFLIKKTPRNPQGLNWSFGYTKISASTAQEAAIQFLKVFPKAKIIDIETENS